MAAVIDSLKDRLAFLGTAIEQSVLNHNALVGRQAELKEIIMHLEKMDAENPQAALEIPERLTELLNEDVAVTEHE